MLCGCASSMNTSKVLLFAIVLNCDSLMMVLWLSLLPLFNVSLMQLDWRWLCIDGT